LASLHECGILLYPEPALWTERNSLFFWFIFFYHYTYLRKERPQEYRFLRLLVTHCPPEQKNFSYSVVVISHHVDARRVYNFMTLSFSLRYALRGEHHLAGFAHGPLDMFFSGTFFKVFTRYHYTRGSAMCVADFNSMVDVDHDERWWLDPLTIDIGIDRRHENAITGRRPHTDTSGDLLAVAAALAWPQRYDYRSTFHQTH
jgi:hypothetical protein